MPAKRILTFVLSFTLGLLASQMELGSNIAQDRSSPTPEVYTAAKTTVDNNCVPDEAFYEKRQTQQKAEIDRIERRLKRLQGWLRRDKGVDLRKTLEKEIESRSLNAQLKKLYSGTQTEPLLYRELCREF